MIDLCNINFISQQIFNLSENVLTEKLYLVYISIFQRSIEINTLKKNVKSCIIAFINILIFARKILLYGNQIIVKIARFLAEKFFFLRT